MAKAELGTKRTCPSCGARFYDMNKSPAACPRCGTKVKGDQASRFRRGSRPVEETAKPKRQAAAPAIDGGDAIEAVADDEEDFDAIGAVDDLADDEDDDLIEDASDLGEDDDDMSEVMEHLDSDKEDKV